MIICCHEGGISCSIIVYWIVLGNCSSASSRGSAFLTSVTSMGVGSWRWGVCSSCNIGDCSSQGGEVTSRWQEVSASTSRWDNWVATWGVSSTVLLYCPATLHNLCQFGLSEALQHLGDVFRVRGFTVTILKSNNMMGHIRMWSNILVMQVLQNTLNRNRCEDRVRSGSSIAVNSKGLGWTQF